MKITKHEMIEMMIDNEYPRAINLLNGRRRRPYTPEEIAHHLQYHTSMEYILNMFKCYLYWKIEGER